MRVAKQFNKNETLERQIARLERRLESLESLSRRFSWYRLAVILIGGVATWAATTYLGNRWGWWVFFASVAGFAIVVALHRRLDGWIEKFRLWCEIKSSQLARLNLDWGVIPLPPSFEGQTRGGLDIDLDLTGPRSLHQLLDTSISQEGSRLLADWLVDGHPDVSQIRERQRVVRELTPLVRFRERLLLAFHLVSKERLRGEELLAWLGEDFSAGKLIWLLPVATLFSAVNITLFLLNASGVLPAFWIASLSLYIGFYYFNLGSIAKFLETVVRLDTELGKFRALVGYLENYPLAEGGHLARLCAPYRDPQRPPSVLMRRIKMVTAAVGLRMNIVMGFALNVLLPWDFACATLAGRYREEVAQLMPRWLETWYRLEALCSLAAFADLHPEYTFPEVRHGASPIFEAQELGHPLIYLEQKVCNDFVVGEPGELTIITGSNMAGKSTFIKTVGVNLCLAYAGGPVNASSFRSLPFRLHTCIRISDSIADGFSYFYSEVKCLRRLLESLKSEGGAPLLYLIDEIFRGTNNRERLIGSQAYVSALIGENGIGFIATHDLELAGLAEHNPQVHNYHFRDHIQDGRLVFDYRIRPGPSPTTNALRIMQMEGLPVGPVES